jgi:uncharacterized protein (TIGR02466 family)
MTKTVPLFPTLIYRDFYSKTNELKENLFSKLEKVFDETKNNNNEFMRKGTLCSYNSNSYLHTEFPEETHDVVAFIEQCAREYWIACGYHTGLDPFVFQMWANLTPKGGYVDSHLHGNMPFTGVLYVDACPEQGNLFVENPMEQVLMSQPIGPTVSYPMGQEIEVKSGDFVLFPGYIRHSVKPNMLDQPRLILAFNIGCRGQYWSSQWNHDV